jgi:hypothetical protein
MVSDRFRWSPRSPCQGHTRICRPLSTSWSRWRSCGPCGRSASHLAVATSGPAPGGVYPSARPSRSPLVPHRQRMFSTTQLTRYHRCDSSRNRRRVCAKGMTALLPAAPLHLAVRQLHQGRAHQIGAPFRAGAVPLRSAGTRPSLRRRTEPVSSCSRSPCPKTRHEPVRQHGRHLCRLRSVLSPVAGRDRDIITGARPGDVARTSMLCPPCSVYRRKLVSRPGPQAISGLPRTAGMLDQPSLIQHTTLRL